MFFAGSETGDMGGPAQGVAGNQPGDITGPLISAFPAEVYGPVIHYGGGAPREGGAARPAPTLLGTVSTWERERVRPTIPQQLAPQPLDFAALASDLQQSSFGSGPCSERTAAGASVLPSAREVTWDLNPSSFPLSSPLSGDDDDNDDIPDLEPQSFNYAPIPPTRQVASRQAPSRMGAAIAPGGRGFAGASLQSPSPTIAATSNTEHTKLRAEPYSPSKDDETGSLDASSVASVSSVAAVVGGTQSKKRKLSAAGEDELGLGKTTGLKDDKDGTKDCQREKAKKPSCCICIEEPDPADLATVNGCEHLFCFGCIEKWADRENTCPLCKERFSEIQRVNICRDQPKKKGAVKNIKKVRNRDQRADMTNGNSLQGLFASMEANGSVSPAIAQLIFSGLMGGRESGRSHGIGPVLSSGGNHGSQAQPHRSRSLAAMFDTDAPPTGRTVPMPPSTSMFRVPEEGVGRIHEAWAGRRPIQRSFLRFGSPDQHPLNHVAASARAPPAAAAASAATPPFGARNDRSTHEESQGGTNQQLEEEEEGYASFAQRVRNMARERNGALERFQLGLAGGGLAGISPSTYRTHNARSVNLPQTQHFQQHPMARRNYAINTYDVDAGETPDNALEIEDSDDEDDVVEVVAVS